MSGMNPNNAIIALLQMRSDKLVSRDYVRREIPMELNVTQEEQRVDIEEMRDSLRVAVAQYAQAIPALACTRSRSFSNRFSNRRSNQGSSKRFTTRNYCGEGVYTRDHHNSQKCQWANKFQQQVWPPFLPRSQLQNKWVRPLLLALVQTLLRYSHLLQGREV
jgi:hypothetical protein